MPLTGPIRQSRQARKRTWLAVGASIPITVALVAVLLAPHACYVKPKPPYVGFRSPAKEFVPQQAPSAQLDAAAIPPRLIVRGSKEERAERTGQALRPQIQHLKDKYLSAYFPNDKPQALHLAEQISTYLTAEEQKSIQALAKGAQIDPQDALLFNTFLDIKLAIGCSSLFVDGTNAPQGPLLGRNLDFGSFGVADAYDALVIEKPSDSSYAFASVTWPGVLGVLSGINEKGLTAVVLVSDGRRGFPGTPVLIAVRRVLERASTVKEAQEILKPLAYASSNNVMIADAQGQALVAELSPDATTFRNSEQGILVAANRFLTPEQSGGGICPRYQSLLQGAKGQKGKLDVPGMQKLLAEVSLGEINLQAMVFAPREKKLWLSVENIPAAKGPYREIDLAQWLEK